MEEQKNHTTVTTTSSTSNGKTCNCGCGCGWQSGHRAFRVVLAVVVAIVIFWIGVKVGEIKGLVESDMNYRYSMHQEYMVHGSMPQNMMMGGQPGTATPVSGMATSSPTAPAVAK